jgi:hypothetical protein
LKENADEWVIPYSHLQFVLLYVYMCIWYIEAGMLYFNCIVVDTDAHGERNSKVQLNYRGKQKHLL